MNEFIEFIVFFKYNHKAIYVAMYVLLFAFWLFFPYKSRVANYTGGISSAFLILFLLLVSSFSHPEKNMDGYQIKLWDNDVGPYIKIVKFEEELVPNTGVVSERGYTIQCSVKANECFKRVRKLSREDLDSVFHKKEEEAKSDL